MAVRALALSGGSARGSFQLGAITALYEVYGFRPDLITGTSVGAINGILLALAPPPAVNDPAAILAAVAAGAADPGLTQLRALHAEWASFLTVDDLYTIQPAFAGTLIADLFSGLGSGDDASAPMSATIGSKIDEFSIWLSIPIVNFVSGPLAADELQKLKRSIMGILTENAVFTMDPITQRLNNPMTLTLGALAAGTPISMATVALESGRLRYIDGMGNFTERDGRTPVMSALMPSDIDAAVDENLQPLAADRAARIKDLQSRYRAAVRAIAAGRAAYRQPSTTRQQRLALLGDVTRNIERGEYLLDVLAKHVSGLRITTNVDPRRGALASSSLPVLSDPVVIGAERYVDAGIREIIPMEIAVRAGVTDLVGICCSSLELPAVDDLSNAGLPTVGLRALTEIAIAEITRDDVAVVRERGISTTLIAPTFDVHGGAEVEPSLIEISSDYGWMRACDEVQPAPDADRQDFRRLSNLITTLRMRSFTHEISIKANDGFMAADRTREPVATVRTLRWIVRELLARRSALGLPSPVQAQRWWRGWAREFRPLGPFETASVWAQLSAFSSNGVEVRVADAVADPQAYAPDSGSLVDAGNDRVWWIVRGAVFPALSETEQATTRLPALVVPHGLFLDLPRIPRGTHVVAEQDTPNDTWIVRNSTRYHAPASLLTAGGLGGQPVAIVPPGGLAQIPDGGAPYWLGGLFVADSQGRPIDNWGPTAQVEGSSTATAIGLINTSGRAVTVTGLVITTHQDDAGPVFAVAAALPLTVPPSTFTWVPVTFTPSRPGPITGTVAVQCDDVSVPRFRVPLSTSATPIGRHGILEITPAGFDLGLIRAGHAAGQDVTLRNAGTRDLEVDALRIVEESPPGQFALPLPAPTRLVPGQSAPVHVSCTPTTRGRLTATLAIEAHSGTDTPSLFEQHLSASLGATAQAPVVFLAGAALPPVLARPGPVFPGGNRPPRLVVELTRLDFGAIAPGTAVVRPFWIRNVGDVPLTVTSVNSTVPGPFGAINLAIFPAVIAPGGELQVDVTFLAPAVVGAPAGADLWIETDDPLRPRAVLAVTGRASGGHLSTQPRELLQLDPGLPPTGQLTILSDGTDPVQVLKVGVQDRDFVISGLPAFPATLPSGSALTLDITYRGTTPGQHDSTLDLTDDISANGSLRILLRAFV